MHKLINIKFLGLLLIVFSAVSCLDTGTTDVEISSDPSFVSLVFKQNDSVPNLEDAAFTLEYDKDLGDSIIVNLDSLPYNTRIDSVFPTFKFSSSSGLTLLMKDSTGLGLDTVILTGSDTIDFTRVISVTNIAEDEATARTYKIKVNVHTVNAELYVWKKIRTDIYSGLASQQKAIYFNNKYWYYLGTGVRNVLFNSTDLTNWSAQTITGLPAGLEFRNIIAFESKIYLAQQGVGVYETLDGINWSKTNVLPAGFEVVNFLFVLNNQFWSIVKSTDAADYHFASSVDGSNWSVKGIIPSNFPVGDFAALSFASRTNKPKALVVGGYDQSGNILRTSWTTEDGLYWVDFSAENTTLDYNAGASIIEYDNKLLMFGGMDANDNVVEKPYLQSFDEGFTWRVPDTTYNLIQDTLQGINYEARSYQSVIYKNDTKQIVLIGGRSKSEVYSDVWTGKLNRLTFIRQ